MMIYDKNKNSCGLRWQIDVFNLLTCILFWHNWGINQFRKTASVLPWPYDATVVWQCPDFQKFWLQSRSISTDCTDMIFVKLSLEIPWQWVLCWHIKKWLESSDDLDFGLTFLIKNHIPLQEWFVKTDGWPIYACLLDLNHELSMIQQTCHWISSFFCVVNYWHNLLHAPSLSSHDII